MKIPKINYSTLKSNIVKKNPQRQVNKKETEVGQINIWIAYSI